MSEIKLNEITRGTTIKEMVEIINSNFTKIVESGGGPTGVPGEDGVAGPEGKRGNGIFVIKDESEIDEGKEYEKEVNEFLKNDSSDSEEGKYKEGDCIIYKSGLYIVKISPDGDNTLVAEYMGTLKGEKGDKGETGSNEEEGGSSNQWKIVDIHGNHYGYQFNGDYKFLIIGSGIDENKLGSYGAEEDYNHSLWILDGEKGIALYGKENKEGKFSKGTISLSSDDKLMLTGASGVCVGDLIIEGGNIKHIGDENKDENFLNLICYNGDGKNANTSIELSESISLNATKSGGGIKLITIGDNIISGNENIITAVSKTDIKGPEVLISSTSSYYYYGKSKKYSGGKIVVDKTGIELSGSDKSINIGVAALKGYDVDIVGKTYIRGDLVVGGDYHKIGDLMVISSKKETPEGWFSNEDLTTVKTIPIKYSQNIDAEPTIFTDYGKYQTFIDYNETIKYLSKNEFEKYLEIGKFISSDYNNSTNSNSIIIVGANEDALETSDESIFQTCFNYFGNSRKDYLKYLYATDGNEDDLDTKLEDDDDGIKFLKVCVDDSNGIFNMQTGNIDVLIFYAFDFNGLYDNNLYVSIKQYTEHIQESFINADSVSTLKNNISSYFNTLFENSVIEVALQKGINEVGDQYPNYASIIIKGLEKHYMLSNIDDKTVKGQSLQVNNDFSLPTYNNDKYYKYIMKYKDSSVETVGVRENKKW